MARRALKAVNWSALAERMQESEKPAFAALKSKYDQYMKSMEAYPEAVPKIDWSFYKKHVAVPGMVEKFQKEYESLSIPYPSDKYTSEIEALEKEMVVKKEKFIEDSNQRIEKYKQELEKINNLIPYAQMTMEDFREAHPELAFDAEKPTLWPHDPEDQPKDNNEKK